MKTTWGGALPGGGSWRRPGGSARRRVMVVVAAGAALACAGLLTGAGVAPAAAVRAGAPSVRWGKAEPVPGLAALNKTGDARVTSLSCWSVNNCAAGGYYDGVPSRVFPLTLSKGRAFVVAERNGRWDRAVQVPGLAALKKGGLAEITSVSCAPGGYCAAAGYYTDGAGHTQAFVVTRPKDRWRAAVEVPGSAALNTSGSAQANSVSCPAAGDCAAGGTYTAAGGALGFVVSQANGVWGTAEEVPGLAALNTGGGAGVDSVSCGSAGNCVAGGPPDNFSAGGFGDQGFVANEENGVWGTAEEVPGLAALNVGDGAGVASVSCARDDYCAAGGTYTPDQYLYVTPFVANGSNGVWGTAAPWGILGGEEGVPSYTTSVSCPSAGSCVALGYTIPGAYWQPFAASQKNGAWGAAKYLPGVFAGDAVPTSLSCPSAGNCGAGGYNFPRAYPGGGRTRPFVASERNGRWANAELYPGTLALNKGRRGQVTAVSCPLAGHCTAAGFYTDAKKHQQGFVGGP
jgi:hypothetical protein